MNKSRYQLSRSNVTSIIGTEKRSCPMHEASNVDCPLLCIGLDRFIPMTQTVNFGNKLVITLLQASLLFVD
jgi:hypothetical protein